MKIVAVLIMLILISLDLRSQPMEAFNNFDSAFKYREFVFEFTFDSNQIRVPKEIRFLTELQTIYFNQCRIDSLPQEVFELPKLKKLVFIKTLNIGIGYVLSNIAQAESIESVIFDGVRIDEDFRMKEKIANIKVLHLIDVKAQYLVNDIEYFPNLELLSIENCPKLSIPASFSCLKKIKDLFLINCQLDSIPQVVLELNSLEGLLLHRNSLIQLKVLDLQLKSLKKIKALGIDGCNITELPKNLCQLTDLEFLSINDNHIGDLPSWIDCLDSLKTILLRNNQITVVPNSLWSLKKLTRVDLGTNNIQKLLPRTDGRPPLDVILLLDKNPLDSITRDCLDKWFVQPIYD